MPSSTRRPRSKRVILVASCSDKKRLTPHEALRLATVTDDELGVRARTWKQRLRKVEAETRPAVELYAGSHWSAVVEAWTTAARYGATVELWIASAGYGLIRSDELIKAYGATFAVGHGDSVWRSARDGDATTANRQWWKKMSGTRSVADLVPAADCVLVAAGAPYITALAHDLREAVAINGGTDRVGVISAGTRSGDAMLPATARFRAIVGGTNGALNARLLAFIARHAAEHDFRIPQIRALLVAALPEQSSPTPTRRPLSDGEVRMAIKELRSAHPTLSRSRALTLLRDSDRACEQKRFARLWNETA